VADAGSVPGLPMVAPVSGGIDPMVLAALMRLPTRQQEVVALRLFLDLETARAGEVLGIAPGTVQAHLGRAIASLRKDLNRLLEKESLP
jgi:DNA-directed RNA polymerase specialized sigma24 family protein